MFRVGPANNGSYWSHGVELPPQLRCPDRGICRERRWRNKKNYVRPDVQKPQCLTTFGIAGPAASQLQGQDLNLRPPGYEPPSAGSECSEIFLADAFPQVRTFAVRSSSGFIRVDPTPPLANR